LPAVPPNIEVPSRVLLVMSDLGEAGRARGVLLELGCQSVELAADGVGVRERLAELRPELVLADASLAHVVNELRNTPVVWLCTGKSLPPTASNAHGLGCVELPVTRERLLRALWIGPRVRRPSDVPETPDERTFRDELLASMAHELRAPLQGVSGFAQFLLDGKAGPVTDSQRSCLEHIGSGAAHVLQLVQDLLDLTDSAADTLHVRTEVVEPERAVREVLQVLQVIAIRRRLTVQLEVDGRLGHVVSDATKLKQVLYNLLSNAFKYTPGTGEVAIGLQRADADSFSIEVRDTGPGLPPGVLAQLQEPLHESKRGRTRGLMLTRRIVEALGGALSAHNTQGGGAVLRAHLPLAPSVTVPNPRVRLPRGAA